MARPLVVLMLIAAQRSSPRSAQPHSQGDARRDSGGAASHWSILEPPGPDEARRGHQRSCRGAAERRQDIVQRPAKTTQTSLRTSPCAQNAGLWRVITFDHCSLRAADVLLVSRVAGPLSTLHTPNTGQLAVAGLKITTGKGWAITYTPHLLI